jgi:hypothetical protein
MPRFTAALVWYSFVVTAAVGFLVGFGLCGGFTWHSHALVAHTLICALTLAGILRRQGRTVFSFVAPLALFSTWYLAQILGQFAYWSHPVWALQC